MTLKGILGIVLLAGMTAYFSAIGYAIISGEVPVVLLSLGLSVSILWIIGDRRESRIVNMIAGKK